ncbi:hypothetical protein [Bacillus sp. T33-2]|uniref:hypothetical protein n=1 Tax=Bacillus sp. T33-2 TaxID=2054168 RepID=UPI000C766436|nr:hypothetical protein [Bacillus sp. T33-2]PLR99547.1 hypothetical protein CVD19_00355 [Bacillus sp. T33-2]
MRNLMHGIAQIYLLAKTNLEMRAFQEKVTEQNINGAKLFLKLPDGTELEIHGDVLELTWTECELNEKATKRKPSDVDIDSK